PGKERLHVASLLCAMVRSTTSPTVNGPMTCLPSPRSATVWSAPPVTLYTRSRSLASPRLVMFTVSENWPLSQSSTAVTVAVGGVQFRNNCTLVVTQLEAVAQVESTFQCANRSPVPAAVTVTGE